MASQDGNSQITQEQFLKNYPNVTLVQTPSKAANNPKKQSPGKATIIPSPSQPALKQQTPSVPKAIPKLPQNISLKPTTPTRQMGANMGKVKQNTPAVSSSAVNVPVSVKTVQQAISPAKNTSTPKSLPSAKAQVVKTPNVVQNHALTATNMIQSPIIANQTVRNKSPMTPRAGIAAKPQLRSYTSNAAAALAMKTQVARTPPNRALVRAKNPNQANLPRPDVALLNKSPTRPPVPPAVPIGKPKEQSLTTASAITTYQSLPQCKSKQITITPTGASNKVIVQQVINDNGQVVIQREVEPVGTSAQSVTVGTTGQTVASIVKQSSSATPQTLEITSSEPVKTIQVTQQVTLISKGNTFNVEDVKKQINQQKQNTMTNVVSSTTNSIPAALPPAQLLVQNQLVEQKKILAPASEGGEIATAPSPVRKVVRPSCATPRHQYPSTQGQVRKVATPVSRPAKDIPMQKVSPMTMMPPPSLPPPELQNHFANEEEVTTSEEIPQASETPTKIVFILPDGQRQEILINAKLPVNLLVRDILDSTTLKKYAGVVTCIPPTINITSNLLPNETEGTQWQAGAEVVEPEPGEITGIVHSNDTEELGVEAGASEEAESAGKEDELEKNSQAVKTRKNKADSSDEGPKNKKCKRKKDEPVCLTISDEDDELGLGRKAAHAAAPEDGFQSDSNSNSQMSSCDKEPIITDDMVSELKQSVSGGGQDSDPELIDISDEKCYLQCRTVRIGSYKVVPKDKVLITPHGLKITVPVLNSDQYVDVTVMIKEIVKVLIHYGRQMPVLFCYTRPNAAAKIRNSLRMTDKKGVYYDSTGEDETHRRITFLPDKIDDECKETLIKIFGRPDNNLIGELTGKEANDILVKASPKEVQAFIAKKTPDQQQQQQPFDGLNIQTIMIYPPPPEKGGIPINTEDYACLEIDQFLNDVIIDFYLKYVVEKTLAPEDRARTHVFSSFFYKRLTTKPPPKRKSMNPVESDPNASAAAKRHSRVKSWTKNVDLFSKDFVIIPINESSHWYLAIVCFPGLTGPVRFSDNTPIDLPGRKKKDTGGADALTSKHEMTIGSTTITAVQQPTQTHTLEGEDGEDRDEADGSEEKMDVPDCPEEEQSILPDVKEEAGEEKPVKKEREPIKQPCILIFDSLAGPSRTKVVATLRDYFRVEFEVKHGHSRDFSGDVLKGSNVKCPQQTNYTDCGLYVLQYVEAFFQWPITDYHIPIKQVHDWFKADIVNRKRYEIQQLLHRLMEEQNIDIEMLNLPKLNLQPEGNLVDYSGSEGEDEGEEDEGICGDEDEEMVDMDGAYEMEQGIEYGDEYGTYDGEDEEGQYIDPEGEHEQHEYDDEYMDDEEEVEEEGGDGGGEDGEEGGEEEDEEMQEDGERELDDSQVSKLNPVKAQDLKNFRIPRLNRSNPTNEG